MTPDIPHCADLARQISDDLQAAVALLPYVPNWVVTDKVEQAHRFLALLAPLMGYTLTPIPTDGHPLNQRDYRLDQIAMPVALFGEGEG